MHVSFYFIVLLNLGLIMHPFHVSVCEIDYNLKQNTLEITHKFFLDDIETALNNRYNKGLDLLGNPDQHQIDELMKSYLKDNFKLTGNGELITLNYLGSEIEDDAIRCYMEAYNISSISTLQVMNSSLVETFDDQQNMIHFYYTEDTKSLLLTGEENTGYFKVDE